MRLELQKKSSTRHRSRGFTLIELIAVMVILAIMAGVAIPRYVDHSQSARRSADEAAIGGIQTALTLTFLKHQATSAPSGEWITTVNDIERTMETGQLPQGIIIVGNELEDQRGNRYSLTAQTASEPAKLTSLGGGSS